MKHCAGHIRKAFASLPFMPRRLLGDDLVQKPMMLRAGDCRI